MTTAGSILNVLGGTGSSYLLALLCKSTFTPSQDLVSVNSIPANQRAATFVNLTLLESATAIGSNGNDMNFMAFNPVVFNVPELTEVSYLVIFEGVNELKIVGYQRVRIVSGNQVQNTALVNGQVTFDNIRVFVRSNTQ